MAPSEPFLPQNQMARPSFQQFSDRPLQSPYRTHQHFRNAERPNRVQRQAIRPVHPQIVWIRHDIGANIADPSDRRRRKIKKRATIDKRKGDAAADAIHCSLPLFTSRATHPPFSREPRTPKQKIRPQAPVPEKGDSTSDEIPVDPSPDESEIEEMKKIMEMMKGDDSLNWTRWGLNDQPASAEVPLYDSKV